MNKKIAFSHCRIMPGGGLNVFEEIVENTDFSEGLIFTMVSDRKYLQTKTKKIKIITALPGFLNNILINTKNIYIKKILDYRNLMPLFPLITYILKIKINLFSPDLTIISSFSIAKNIKSKGKKVLYLHSPNQYIRENYKEYINKLRGLKKRIFILVSKYLKIRDLGKNNFDIIYSNSLYTQKCANKIYKLESKVLYPQIRNEFIDNNLTQEIRSDYYVFIGRVVKFVRECDKIINLFNKTGDKLIIIGDGPDLIELKKYANKNIIFKGKIDNTIEIINYIKNSKGLINLSKESFGIGTAESMLLGTPIFGYNRGGSSELVSKKEGVLIDSKSEIEIEKKFNLFKKQRFNYKEIRSEIIKKLNKYSDWKNFYLLVNKF